MKFIGYPIEIWAACIVAVLIKLQTSNKLTLLGAIATTVVALFSGIILYQPIMAIFGLAEAWSIPLAIIISLSAENLMKALVEMSADKEWLKDWIHYLVTKKERNNDNLE